MDENRYKVAQFNVKLGFWLIDCLLRGGNVGWCQLVAEFRAALIQLHPVCHNPS